jgi:hypothetical protein
VDDFCDYTFVAVPEGQFVVVDNVGPSSPNDLIWFSQSLAGFSPAPVTEVQLQFVLRGAAVLPSSDPTRCRPAAHPAR